MDRPSVLESLVLGSAQSFLGIRLRRAWLLALLADVEVDCCWETEGRLRFCKASAAVWSSEKKQRLPLS
jgi:hypothetical protein